MTVGYTGYLLGALLALSSQDGVDPPACGNASGYQRSYKPPVQPVSLICPFLRQPALAWRKARKLNRAQCYSPQSPLCSYWSNDRLIAPLVSNRRFSLLFLFLSPQSARSRFRLRRLDLSIQVDLLIIYL